MSTKLASFLWILKLKVAKLFLERKEILMKGLLPS